MGEPSGDRGQRAPDSAPSPEAIALASALRDAPTFSGESFEDMRVRLEEAAARRPPLRGTEITPVDEEDVSGEWVRAPVRKGGRAVLYLHGGGYCVGSEATHRDFASVLASACGAPCLSLDYALAPEDPFPAAVDDALAAYIWLCEQGLAPSDIVFAGDEAGAGLALSALIELRDAGEPLPAATVVISPWVDLALSGESLATHAGRDPVLRPSLLAWMADAYLDETDADEASPLTANLAGLPPTFVHVGSEEVLLDDARRLAERAAANGTPVHLEIAAGMVHGSPRYGDRLPEARAALSRIGEFVAGAWAVRPSHR